VIVVVGLSHKTAPIEVRERLAIGRDALPELLGRLTADEAIGEAVVLSTCNRVEVYASVKRGPKPRTVRPGEITSALDDDAGTEDTARAVARVMASIGGPEVAPHLVRTCGREAVEHLYRVAASLDSLVIGEPQILGQLKNAIEIARETRSIGPNLGKAMHGAVRTGKRVRSETQIGAGQVSVASVAIDLARQIFGELAGHRAMMIGAGEMAEAAAKLIARAGVELVVVNRSLDRGTALASDVGGQARPWAELERTLVEADIVISSTSSSGYVIPLDLAKRVRKQRKGRSLFLIDIAVPRDVDPAVNDLDSVFLYDVDDLSQIVAESLEGRAAEAARAEAIVREEVRSFEAWTLERALTPTITSLRARTLSMLSAEVERSLSGKLRHLGQPEREALSIMVEAATNKLLHAPVTRLRSLAADERAGDYLEALHDLFELDAENGQAADGAAPRSRTSGRPRASARAEPEADRRG
jgi:glutamyl-tRNA reductase